MAFQGRFDVGLGRARKQVWRAFLNIYFAVAARLRADRRSRISSRNCRWNEKTVFLQHPANNHDRVRAQISIVTSRAKFRQIIRTNNRSSYLGST